MEEKKVPLTQTKTMIINTKTRAAVRLSKDKDKKIVSVNLGHNDRYLRASFTFESTRVSKRGGKIRKFVSVNVDNANAWKGDNQCSTIVYSSLRRILQGNTHSAAINHFHGVANNRSNLIHQLL